AHLARYHEVFIDRVSQILARDEPTFGAYVAEQDPEWSEWQTRSFEESMLRLHATRDALVVMLEAVSAAQWTRSGRHPRYGVLSLRGWLELFLAPRRASFVRHRETGAGLRVVTSAGTLLQRRGRALRILRTGRCRRTRNDGQAART